MSGPNQYTFNWSVTNRDIVMMIPNYGRRHLILPGLRRFKTDVPRDKWILLIANDCKHEDFSDLEEEFNLAWFTFEREPAERNGSQIRNVVIRNVQSRILASRDPEIIVHGSDYVKRLLSLRDDQVHRPHGTTELREQDVQEILRDDNLDVSTLPVKRRYRAGNAKVHEGFHFCFATGVELLRSIGGYDEDFRYSYGWEDVHLLNRLHIANAEFIMDPNFHAYHTWHPRRVKFLRGVNKNGTIYESKMKKLKLVANENREWGLGL